MSDPLDAALAGWTPAPVAVTRSVLPGPIAAFADILDQRVDVAEGAPVPLLWHWLAFVFSTPQRELGEDGHPRSGRFLPALEHRRRMVAGGTVVQHQPLRVGAIYRRVSELTGAQVKAGRSGRMLFTTVRHTVSDGQGNEVLTETERVVYRQQPPGTARGIPPVEGADPGWDAGLGGDGRLSFGVDPRTLFRFSALTYNTHRIHYDQPYATGVEGYPGLVVHGPLLALHMAEVLRRAGLAASAFDYRLSAPAFCGRPTVAVRDEATLRVGSAGTAVVSAEATAGY